MGGEEKKRKLTDSNCLLFLFFFLDGHLTLQSFCTNIVIDALIENQPSIFLEPRVDYQLMLFERNWSFLNTDSSILVPSRFFSYNFHKFLLAVIDETEIENICEVADCLFWV